MATREMTLRDKLLFSIAVTGWIIDIILGINVYHHW